MYLAIPSPSALLSREWKLPEAPCWDRPRRRRSQIVSRSLSVQPATRFSVLRLGRQIPCLLRCSKSTQNSADENIPDQKKLEVDQWRFLQPWDVPWDWKVTLYVMLPYLMSIAFAGFAGSAGLTGPLQSYSESLRSHLQSPDELSMQLFMDQLLKTVAKLAILFALISPYRPFPDDIFSYRWNQPFNLQHGWISWSCGGLIIASTAVLLVKTFIPSADQMQNEAESLVRLLPLIGKSDTSTFFLLGILGFLAPVSEEILYRGFLMISLTKWVPVQVAILLSSAVFTLAHQTPGKFIEIFIFGTVLGLVYAKTRNLLTPITMHACWNMGVVLILAFLQSQGHEIEKYAL